MSIENGIGEFVVECDFPSCEVTESFEKDETAGYGEDNGFLDMVDSLKEDGWKIYKSEETGEWHHLCPDHNN